jgi:hypothetical protein
MKTDNIHREGCRPAARIDLGLAVMSAWAKSEVKRGYTSTEIAAWCECSRERIRQIERRALLKLRHLVIWGHRRGELGPVGAIIPKDLPVAPAVDWSKRGEMPLGKWIEAEAVRMGLHTRAMWARYYRYPSLRPVMRRVSKRTILVQLPKAA